MKFYKAWTIFWFGVSLVCLVLSVYIRRPLLIGLNLISAALNLGIINMMEQVEKWAD